MKSISTTILILISTYSFSQDWTGTFYVDQMDPALWGSYLTFEFGNEKQFKVYSSECKSVDEGKGTYEVINDSIFFFFKNQDTNRTEVNQTKLQFDSSNKVKLTFEMFTKIRLDSIDFFDIKVQGQNIDTTFTSMDYKYELELPKSNDTLEVTLSIPALIDKVVFKLVPNESTHYQVWTTHRFDRFITEQIWKYRLERKNKNSFTLSTDGKKMKFKKQIPNPKLH